MLYILEDGAALLMADIALWDTLLAAFTTDDLPLLRPFRMDVIAPCATAFAAFITEERVEVIPVCNPLPTPVPKFLVLGDAPDVAPVSCPMVFMVF